MEKGALNRIFYSKTIFDVISFGRQCMRTEHAHAFIILINFERIRGYEVITLEHFLKMLNYTSFYYLFQSDQLYFY